MIQYKTDITDEISGQRYYVDTDDERYPSVTTLISKYEDKRWLEKWRNNIGEEEANRRSTESSQLGTETHAQIEDFLNRVPDPRTPNPYAVEAINAFYSKVEPRLVEEAVFYRYFRNPTVRFAGRVDNMVYVPKNTFGIVGENTDLPSGNYVIDLKTKATGLPPLYSVDFVFKNLLQGAAYVSALSQDMSIEGFILVYVNYKQLKRKPSYAVSKVVYLNKEKLAYYWERFYRMLLDYYGLRPLNRTWNELIAEANQYYDPHHHTLTTQVPAEIKAIP